MEVLPKLMVGHEETLLTGYWDSFLGFCRSVGSLGICFPSASLWHSKGFFCDFFKQKIHVCCGTSLSAATWKQPVSFEKVQGPEMKTS